MNTLRILITGSRNYSDKDRIRRVFRNLIKKFDEYDNFTLVSGNCPTGADNIAEQIAKELQWEIELYPAEWNKHGKKAGPIRNQLMVDTKPDVCLAFPLGKSYGTYDCVKRAEKSGILTKVFK